MELTKELIEKAKTAKSAEELLETAKAEGAQMTAGEAARAFAELHKSGELADDELDNVAGGESDTCEEQNRRHPYIGAMVTTNKGGITCSKCHYIGSFKVTAIQYSLNRREGIDSCNLTCPVCNTERLVKPNEEDVELLVDS